MSSADVLVGLPEHYAHILESSDSSYASTLPPSVHYNTSLKREPSFTQFPRIEELPETPSHHLTPVQEKEAFIENDLSSVGGTSSSLDGSSGISSPDDEPPTPLEPLAITALTQLPRPEEKFPSFFDDFEWGTNFTLAEPKLHLMSPVVTEMRIPPPPPPPPVPASVPSTTKKLRRRSWKPTSAKATPRTTSPERKAPTEHDKALAALEGVSTPPTAPTTHQEKAKRRNSWMPSSKSRAPSPEPPMPKIPTTPSITSSRPSSRRPPTSDSGGAPPVLVRVPTNITSNDAQVAPPSSADAQQKKGRRLSGIFSGSSAPSTPKRSQEEPRSAGGAIVSRSLSADKLPGLAGSFGSFDRLSSLASKASKDSSRLGKSSSLRRRDEAWGAFKALDADFSKFSGKSSAVKATIVRASLMPFMKTHSSLDATGLRAEDLEKRTAVLNKWWKGLLDMLDAQNNANNTALSTIDRPLVFDAISLIMERPEWRATGSPLLSSRERLGSSSSDSSASSDFVAEAIYHNIRNTFTQNLTTQMGFAVDKMSSKATPTSTVSFCGKTCAYVFFFVSGAARFLISLWKPLQETMRSVLDECGVPRHSVMGGVSERVVANFPPHLQELRFVSLTKTLRYLQKSPLPPLGTTNLDWYGPWLKKWSGQESDLFYTFVRSYHTLAVDFLPAYVKKVERICTPGLLMIHAQLLANLDATIHREEATELAKLETTDITFDDVLAEPNASATGVPFSPANVNRLMAENRIVMLLRDCLSERNIRDANARRFFAESFNDVLQAATKKTSLFNQHACYTLCDFLEEAIAILVRYENTCEDGFKILNWPFWFTVWRKMMQSQNTSTLVRLFSLLYTTWAYVTEDEERKLLLCDNFILDPEVFMTHFNHWCPMVRGYYMRLLSWRVARYDFTTAVDSDTQILARLMERLSVVWGHFLYSKCPPGTLTPSEFLATPNPPAPGRRLLIIRTDSLIHAGLEEVAQSPNIGSRARSNSWMDKRGHGGLPDSLDSKSEENPEPDNARAPRWSLLRSVVSPNNRSKSQSPKPEPRDGDSRSSSGRSSPVKQDAPPRSADLKPPVRHVRQRSGSMPAAPRHRLYSFKFSLEYVDRRFQSPSSMVLAPPVLPAPAQSHLANKYNIAAMFNDIRPTRPQPAAMGVLSYTGRALAEWTNVVNECQNFFERRIREGVPSSKLVETPTLGVETFRRPG